MSVNNKIKAERVQGAYRVLVGEPERKDYEYDFAQQRANRRVWAQQSRQRVEICGRVSAKRSQLVRRSRSSGAGVGNKATKESRARQKLTRKIEGKSKF